MIAVHDEILTADDEDPMFDKPGITLFIDRRGANDMLKALFHNELNEDTTIVVDALRALRDGGS